jgi:hypothetical protein
MTLIAGKLTKHNAINKLILLGYGFKVYFSCNDSKDWMLKRHDLPLN